MHSPLSIIPCADLTEEQIFRVRTLTVSAQQEEFGGAFKDTLTASLTHPTEAKFGICFFSDSDPIGMVLLKRPRSPDWVSDNEVSLHALKIDQRWRERGSERRPLLLQSPQQRGSGPMPRTLSCRWMQTTPRLWPSTVASGWSTAEQYSRDDWGSNTG